MLRLAIFFVLLGSFSVGANAECKLTIPESPPIAAVRLGMSPEDVNAALAGAARVKVKSDEQTSYFKSFRKPGKAKGALKGARAFFVRFFERRVYQVEIFYHEGSRPTNLESFVEAYSNASGFPQSTFVIKHGYATAKCDGFVIRADTKLNPHIEITDEVALKKLEDS